MKFSETEEGKKIIYKLQNDFNEMFGTLEDEKVLIIRTLNEGYKAGEKAGQESNKVNSGNCYKHKTGDNIVAWCHQCCNEFEEQARQEAFAEIEKFILQRQELFISQHGEIATIIKNELSFLMDFLKKRGEKA